MGESSRTFSSAFNRVVRRHRLAQDLSQEALSERADVDRTYVGLLERGHRGVGLDVAKRLAEALGLSLRELVAEAEEEWQQGQLPERHLKAPQPVVAEPKEPWQTVKRPGRRKRRRT
jgi:transcriptional regulator with XRE-family HTH domain